MEDSIPGFDPHSEGALARFDRGFVERVGPESVFVRALSDLWTIAFARLLSRHERLGSGKPLMLYSNEQAVGVVRALCAKDEALKRALFQEPFGFAPSGAIEEAFGKALGPDQYHQWLDAIEHEHFDRCHSLVD